MRYGYILQKYTVSLFLETLCGTLQSCAVAEVSDANAQRTR